MKKERFAKDGKRVGDRIKNKGTGRKKLPDTQKKVAVQVYYAGDKVESIGGIKKAREILIDALDKAAE